MNTIIYILICLIITLTITNILMFYFIKRKKGIKGDKGPKGDIGDRGDRGDNGTKGERGKRGDIGIKTNNGIKGPKGDKGYKGDKGPKGEKGFKGLLGDKGDKGPKGIKGDDGEKGKNGLPGPIGLPRIINNYGDLNLVADKFKCIKLYDNDNDLVCPNNMSIFEIETRKVGEEIKIDNVICCPITIENDIQNNYFNRLDINTKLLEYLNKIKIKNGSTLYETQTINNIINQYSDLEQNKLIENIDYIINVTGPNLYSYREIPMKYLEKITDEPNNYKLYTQEQQKDIEKKYNSITDYELYLINKLYLLIKKEVGTSKLIPDYEILIYHLIQFPFNDIEQLENITSI